MEFLKYGKWLGWMPGLFALTGIFYARRLFEFDFLKISFWFFVPFFLAGIASELMVYGLSARKNFRLMSDSERQLSNIAGWRMMVAISLILFSAGFLLAYIFTHGMHTSWYVVGMGCFSVLYGALLRRVWMVDLLTFPLFYLIPAIAGTLDTMLPLYATQIVVIYFFGMLAYAVRLAVAMESSAISATDQRSFLLGGTYDRANLAYLLGLAAAAFCFSMVYHILDRAASVGRMSLLVIPLMIYVIVSVRQRYSDYSSDTAHEKNFGEIFWNHSTRICILLAVICMSAAVHWKL
jgi:hypothetical protein